MHELFNKRAAIPFRRKVKNRVYCCFERELLRRLKRVLLDVYAN